MQNEGRTTNDMGRMNGARMLSTVSYTYASVSMRGWLYAQHNRDVPLA